MYQDETHEPQLNELTKRLYSEGFTRENHPDYVYWGDWQNFGYKWEHMLTLTWETPCGLLVRGDSDSGRGLAISDMSFDGVWYCPENDNPDISCPLGKKDCPHKIPWSLALVKCPCHQTKQAYDYEHSVEKLEAERDKEAHRQYMEITGGEYCACVVGNSGYDGGLYQIEYDPLKCIRWGCTNETCVIRKQPRDLSKVNVFYDIRRTWITRTGFLEDKKVEIEKGVKVFKKPIARTDAEIWMKLNGDEYVKSHSHKTPDDRRMQFFTQMHRKWPDYDYFEFHFEVENIRIDNVRPARDLLQDLQDAAEGIEVKHASDELKAAAQKKRDAKEDRKEEKSRKLERKKITRWKQYLETGVDGDGEPLSESMRDFCQRELKKRGIVLEQKQEQISLFGGDGT